MKVKVEFAIPVEKLVELGWYWVRDVVFVQDMFV